MLEGEIEEQRGIIVDAASRTEEFSKAEIGMAVPLHTKSSNCS